MKGSRVPEEMFSLLEREAREAREGRWPGMPGTTGEKTSGWSEIWISGGRGWKTGPRKFQRHIFFFFGHIGAGCVAFCMALQGLLVQFYLCGALL